MFRGRKYFTEKVLPSIYELMLSKVKSIVQDTPFYSVTMDTWSSAENKHSLLSLTLHYLDENMKHCCAILGAKPINGRHTAENLKTLADSCFNDYGIPKDKIHMITRDAASTMKKVAKDLEIESIDCFAHKLDLVIF